MAANEGKGSILLKLLIVVLVVVLIAVIIVPGKIWDEESSEQLTAQDNMSSIFEAEKFYKRLHKKYTSDPAELLRTVREDSSLRQLDQVVQYTKELKGYLAEYLNVGYTKSIVKINQNMTKIQEDIQSNNRNFNLKKDGVFQFEDIKNEAAEIKMIIGELNGSPDFQKYVAASLYLDSLVQLKRNLSDFTLQICALKSKNYTDSLKSVLSGIDAAGLEQKWLPVSARVDKLIKDIKGSNLVNITSVADRIKDFKNAVDLGFEEIKMENASESMSKSNEIAAKIDGLYQKFLQDFIITSKFALLKMTLEDSLVYHLTEDNFLSPVTNEMYTFTFNADSSTIKVESPILLKENKENAAALASQIAELPPMQPFGAYLDTLETIKAKAYDIRRKIRKNTDLFIQYKEIEALIGEFANISVYAAYNDCNVFISTTADIKSYSDLKVNVENALNGVRIYRQAYSENVFGNLDTLHLDLQRSLSVFDSLLSKVRRLPRGIENFEQDKAQLDDLLADIKNAGSPAMLDKLASLETELGELYLLMSKGKQVPVFGVFKKQIKNFGYIHQDTKSWEEEEDNE